MPRPERPIDPQLGVLHEFAAELRELRRAAGTPSYRKMVEAVGCSVTSLSDAAGGRRLPGLGITLAYVRACGGDPQEWEARWRRASEAQVDNANIDAPYQGLRWYDTVDAPRYFGRSRLVGELVAALAVNRFVAVVGPSGSGKSSLLRAGLLPALSDRSTAVLSPGEHPLTHLTAERAQRDLVVVDQFEEVFTLSHDPAERARFVDALIALAEDERGGAVVIGVRVDFLGDCLLLPALAERLSSAVVFVGPMSDDELREVITGPAAMVGLTVERALVGQALAETKGQPGALPLLSHALRETWRSRRSTVLTLGAFQSTGGVSGAVARTAEQVFQSFDPGQQRVAQEILLRLTALGDGAEDTRRQVRRDELDFPGAEQVVAQLVDARLLVTGDNTVDIAHEALIRAWPRLRSWLAGDREALRTQRQLTEATRIWLDLSREPSMLYRGTRLALVREWAAAGNDGAVLTGVEREFLQASVAADAAEQVTSARRARQLRMLTVGLAATLVLALAAGGVAVGLWRAAVDRAHQATSENLARKALAVAPTDVATAMRLSLSAYRSAPTVEARGALLSIASRHAYTSRLQHAEEVKDVAFTADGGMLATAGQDGRVLVWDTRTRRVVRTLDQPDGAVRTVAVHGRVLAAGTLGGTVRLWDIDTGAALVALHGPDQRVSGVAFEADGTTVAAVGADAWIYRWHLPDGQVLPRLPTAGGQRTDLSYGPDGMLAVVDGHPSLTVWDTRRGTSTVHPLPSPASTVAVSPDGQRIAVGGDAPDITVVSRAGGPDRQLRGHSAYVRSLAFDATGRRLVSGGNDDFAIVWDVGSGVALAHLTGHTSEVYGVAMDPAGDDVATASRDSSVLTYEVRHAPLTGHLDNITSLAVSPDGRRLVSGSRDTTVRTWDPSTGNPGGTLAGHTARVAAVAVAPDGTVVASASDDRTIQLWDAAAGTPLMTLRDHTDLVLSLAFDGHGVLASGSADKTVRLWRADGTPLGAPLAFAGQVTKVVFDRAGKLLVVATRDGLITLVDLTSGMRRELHTGANATDVALSPTEPLLAVGDNTGTVSLWSTTDGTQVTLPRKHTGTVTALAFSPDGATLASGSMDQSVVLWSVRERAVYAVLSGTGANVLAVAWSPAGGRLYTAGNDRMITRWMTRPDDAAEVLRADVAAERP
jgi:WD40 repeat protein/energy-coupling factor transporter ATP-binding protein EcfA2